MHLRCPECETRRAVTVGRAAVERINRSLHEAARTLARETERLTRRNFEEEAERIADALRLGRIEATPVGLDLMLEARLHPPRAWR